MNDSSVVTWNLVDDVGQLFAYHFMVNAIYAGTIIAVAAGIIGWFVVVRRQTFVAHTLALVGFPGAAGATLLGVAAIYGFFAFCGAAALVVALTPRGAGGQGYSEESAVIGVVQATALACGFLFVSLYRGFLNGTTSLLFGNFVGITDDQVLVVLAVSVLALCALGVIARPLLFASLDPAVAAAAGVPVRLLSIVFLFVLGLSVAEVGQLTGTLLVFALLVTPAATAQLLTARPLLSLLLSVVIGLLVTWLALAVAFYSAYPIGFYVTTLAFAVYVIARAVRALRAGGRGASVRRVAAVEAAP